MGPSVGRGPRYSPRFKVLHRPFQEHVGCELGLEDLSRPFSPRGGRGRTLIDLNKNLPQATSNAGWGSVLVEIVKRVPEVLPKPGYITGHGNGPHRRDLKDAV